MVGMLALTLIGCAETSISTPDGLRYVGQKAVSADEIKVKKWHPNGQPALEFEAKGLTSDPTAVNAGTASLINKALDKVPSVPLAPR
jgi:hypothetical protein